MDEINDFFDFSKEFERLPPPQGATTGELSRSEVEKNVFEKPSLRALSSEDYAREARLEEQRKMETLCVNEDDEMLDAVGEDMENCDTFTDIEGDDNTRPSNFQHDAVFDIYKLNYQRDESLPIFQYREEIVSKIRANHVMILKGETGCGKTTQVSEVFYFIGI